MKCAKRILLILLCLLLTGCAGDKDTLSDLCPVERETVTCIDLWNECGHCCLGFSDYLTKTWAVLDCIEYETQIQTGTYDPNKDYHRIVYFSGEDSTPVYLNEDYSRFIPVLDPEAEHYEFYPVKNPEALKALFEEHIDIVYNLEITAAPFAESDEPYQWMQRLTPDALATVRYTHSVSGNSSGGGTLSKAGFKELCSLLKTISADALANPGTVSEGAFDHITTYYTDKPNLAVSFQDEANDLGVVVRYYEENEEAHLEILMIDGADSVSSSNRGKKIQPVPKWDIESPELLDWFRKAADYPPYAALRYGHWMDYDAERGIMEVSDGTSTLRVRSFEGWTYEITEPSENSENFGIRCRHPKQTEGWIYISLWPEGYESSQINRYVNSSDDGYYSYSLKALYPNGTETEGVVWYEQVHYYENGDMVILNEGADHWFPECAEDIAVQTTYIWEDVGERVTREAPEVTIDLDYTQADDWSTDFVWFKFDTADPMGLSLSGWAECGWVHDDTPEGENVLLTYWPEYETEGLVCIEYHEGFFQPPEDMTVEDDILHIDSYGSHPAKRGILPGDDRWTYFWIDRKNGSYVFRFENTEHWTDRKIEECLWALHTIQFRG